jgi:hypothetical protein
MKLELKRVGDGFTFVAEVTDDDVKALPPDERAQYDAIMKAAETDAYGPSQAHLVRNAIGFVTTATTRVRENEARKEALAAKMAAKMAEGLPPHVVTDAGGIESEEGIGDLGGKA